MGFPTSSTRSSHTAFYRARSRTGIWASIRFLSSLYRSRQALSRLSERELDDIGVSRRDALNEAQRPIWDVPQHWLR